MTGCHCLSSSKRKSFDDDDALPPPALFDASKTHHQLTSSSLATWRISLTLVSVCPCVQSFRRHNGISLQPSSSLPSTSSFPRLTATFSETQHPQRPTRATLVTRPHRPLSRRPCQVHSSCGRPHRALPDPLARLILVLTQSLCSPLRIQSWTYQTRPPRLRQFATQPDHRSSPTKRRQHQHPSPAQARCAANSETSIQPHTRPSLHPRQWRHRPPLEIVAACAAPVPALQPLTPIALADRVIAMRWR